MSDEVHVTKFLELFQYVPYLKEENNIYKWVVTYFKNIIKFDEPLTVEYEIRNLNHFYKKSKCRPDLKVDLKAKGNFDSIRNKQRNLGQQARKRQVSPPTKIKINRSSTFLMKFDLLKLQEKRQKAMEEDPSSVGLVEGNT